MTVQDAAEIDGAVPDPAGRDAAEPPSPGHGERRVVKVSRATVAAAYAQVNLSTKLGLPVPPAVAKIAALARPYGPSVPGTDGVSGG